MNCANCDTPITLRSGEGIQTTHREQCLGADECRPVLACSVVCEQVLATEGACTVVSADTFDGKHQI